MIIDDYLNYLQEREKPEIKYAKGPVYLYHGTANTPEQIKTRGLTMEENGRNEGDRTHHKQPIWFSSSVRYASQYARRKGRDFKAFFLLSEKIGLILKCKLDKKYLELAEDLILFDEYMYFANVPPKDIEIIWNFKTQGKPKFKGGKIIGKK
jgi:hypothetical protein